MKVYLILFSIVFKSVAKKNTKNVYSDIKVTCYILTILETFVVFGVLGIILKSNLFANNLDILVILSLALIFYLSNIFLTNNKIDLILFNSEKFSRSMSRQVLASVSLVVFLFFCFTAIFSR